MEFFNDYQNSQDDIIGLFEAVFSASEGPEEGKLIGKLAKDFLEMTPIEDIFVFSVSKDGRLSGCSIFTRLFFAEDERTTFILSPMAVEVGQQGKGVGQALLMYGLTNLRERGVDVVITYGDPKYYSKVGFVPITEDIAQAPLVLHQPEGWLAQSLTNRPLHPFTGVSRCVDALNDPAYW